MIDEKFYDPSTGTIAEAELWTGSSGSAIDLYNPTNTQNDQFYQKYATTVKAGGVDPNYFVDLEGSAGFWFYTPSSNVGANGLPTEVDSIIGLDPTRTSNLVPGMTDLAAIQAGLVD
jgi:hypothetical protein